jgi:phenylacetic acid degradation operon negative regulatory protein
MDLMRASTELFLWQVLSIAGALYRPSYRHVNESFEGWAYRNGLLRQMQRLEAEAYLERQPGGNADRVYRLTPKGRLAALGGKDPEAQWNRPWDGKWRLLMFDLPRSPGAPRARLRTVLREHGLGCLQGSVWLSPDPLENIRKELRGDRHPSSLLLFEGCTAGGEKPRELVREAWNFESIGRVWRHYANTLERGRKFLDSSSFKPAQLHEWGAREHEDWKWVIEVDPLLPAELLPRNYPGRKIWRKRLAFWKKLSSRLHASGFRSAETARH